MKWPKYSCYPPRRKKELTISIDGVMRLDECEQVQKDLSEHLGINLTVVDASQQFLDDLKGVEDPEKKRKIIGMSSD